MLKVLLPVAALAFLPAAFAHSDKGGCECVGDVTSWSFEECNACVDLNHPDVLKDGASHTLCQDAQDCWAKKSTEANTYDNCMADAQRKFEMTMNGKTDVAGGTNVAGDKTVVTDVDNSNYTGGNDGDKGHNDAR